MTQMSNADVTSTIAPHLQTLRNQLVLFAGWASVLVGVSVLYGWAAGVEALKSVLPGLATMKPNTALVFILAGGGLLTRRRDVGTKWPTVFGCTCSAIVAGTGLLTLIEYGIHWNLGIDELLFRDPAGILANGAPGRMAAATALVFVFLGGALFASHLRRDKTAQALALVAAFISFLACIGYLYGVAALYGIAPYSSMAIHTAATALLLCVGVLAVSSQSGPAALFGSIGPAGIISRRLVAVATILPLVLGWLVLTGCRSGLYASEFGLALFTLSIIVVLNSVILWTTGQLRRESDERNAAEQKLRQSEERFRLVVESAPNGMVMIDETGRIVLVNALAEKLFGYKRQELLGQPLEMLVPERFRSSHPASRDGFFHSPAARSMGGGRDLFGRRKDGTEFPVEIGLNPIRTESGLLVLSAIVDISERKRSEAERQKFVSLADSSQEFIGMCDRDFTPFYANVAGLRTVGLESLDAAKRVNVQEFFFPEDQPFIMNEFFPRVVREGFGEVEIRFRHFQTGEPIWMLYNVFNIRDEAGTVVGWATVSRNIHERKLAEQALRENERRFVEQTMAAREDEQRRIARDLHDGIGQSLTSLRLGLRVVEDAANLEAASSAAHKLRSIVVAAQDEVRRLTRNLRPSVLDDLGLGPALARIADDCMQAHGIKVSLDLSNLETPRLPEALETALFRIAQEALTNVVKHAQATDVEMVIHRTPNAVDMSISDNGVGLKQPPQDKPAQPHFGLMGIRERAALLKGTVQIHGPPRGGVAIQVTIPHSEVVNV